MDKITERQKSQYNFGDFALNLNHLNLQLMKDICPTDARLRSDQRAFEDGLDELASTEKLRYKNISL